MMKKIVLGLVCFSMVFGLGLKTVEAQSTNLSQEQLFELLILLNIIPKEKVEMARQLFANRNSKNTMIVLAPIGIRAENSVKKKQYELSLSGGKKDKPVKRWDLEITCSSNVVNVEAKAAGNLCLEKKYSIGTTHEKGDANIPLMNLKVSKKGIASNIKFAIVAVGENEQILHKTNHTIDIDTKYASAMIR